MTHHLLPRRLLESANSSANEGALQAEGAVNSDFILILAALLCALICVLGLIAVARCACFRRRFSSSSSGGAQYHPRYNKGLKKAALRSLPKLTFSDELTPKLATAECPICLSEFVSGDEIRILPQCGHTFHLSCIDTWLGSHSSCPSCRQILAVPRRCQRCGGLPLEQEVSTNDDSAERGREGDNTFLP